MRQQRVLVRDVRVGMKANRGDIVSFLVGRFVQGLNVFQNVLEFEIAGFNLVRREPVEHEGVVRIGRVREGDGSCLSLLLS